MIAILTQGSEHFIMTLMPPKQHLAQLILNTFSNPTSFAKTSFDQTVFAQRDLVKTIFSNICLNTPICLTRRLFKGNQT